MKKLSNLLFLAVLALGVMFTACDKEDVLDGPNGPVRKGDTHMSVSINLGQSQRAGLPQRAANYEGTWGGEDVIEEISVYLLGDDVVEAQHFTIGTDDDQFDVSSNNIYKPNKAIKTFAGEKEVYVVVNATPKVKAQLNVFDANDFKNAYEGVIVGLVDSYTTSAAGELAEIDGGKDKIVMTTVEAGELTVKAGVEEDEAAVENSVTVEVERVVARAVVTHTLSSTIQVKDGATVIGTLTDLKWAVAQGEQTIYLQRKDNWATPNFAFVPGDGADNFYYDTADKYDYSHLANPADVLERGFNVDADNIGDNSLSHGQFLLPNTHEYAQGGENYTGGYRKGNTAYVQVSGIFTPTTVWTQPIIDGKVIVDGQEVDGKVKGELKEVTAFTAGDDFYLGVDGKFYDTAQSAFNATGVAQMTLYKGGKALYFAWLNPDDKAQPYNSPVRRNEIYHINIIAFNKIGTNWNPLYPGNEQTPPSGISNPDHPNYDPTSPDYDPEKDSSSSDYKPEKDPFHPNYDPTNPDNPSEKPSLPGDVIVPDTPGDGEKVTPETPVSPMDPEDPPTTLETWMSVEVKVLPWKTHYYDIEF